MLRYGAVGIVGLVFSIIGAVSLAVGLALADSQLEFRKGSVSAEGQVVALEQSCSDGCTYRPVVEFSVDDEPVRITGGVGSSPPAHEVGETVRVLYRPGETAEAQIDSWLESWFGTAFGLGFGAIFGGIGFPMLILTLRRRADMRWAEQFGTVVQTRFTEVMHDTRVKVNGRSPYRICSQWQSPRDGKVYRFESDPMWLDPAEYLKGREQITVKLDPDRPKRYWMDTGFLPKAG